MLAIGSTWIPARAFAQQNQAIEEARPTPTIIAKMGADTLSKEEFLNFVRATNPLLMMGQDAALREALDEYVNFHVVVKEADASGLRKLPEVQHQMKQILFQAYVQKNFSERVESFEISKKRVENFYEENPILRTRQVMLHFPAELDAKKFEEIKLKASEIHKEITSGKLSFDEAVAKYSDDASKSYGGMMPESGRFAFAPEYYDAARKLKPNQVSKPVQSLTGIHIIQLVERLPLSKMTPAYADEITQHFKANHGKKLLENHIAELRKKFKTEVYKDRLK